MAYCNHPFKKNQDDEISFPCGKCLDCRKRRASSWGFRLAEQLKVSDTAYFITLTYDSDHVPITPKGRTSLDWGYKTKKDTSTHLSRFFKQLRKKQPTNDIKYYACGEYGGTSKMRPHYHVIIFNMYLHTLLDQQEARRALALPQIYMKGKFPFNSELWPYGHITVGTVTNASAMYTLKYLSKPKRVPQYKYDDRKPEFSVISKGIGKSYLSPEIIQWHRDDLKDRMYVHFQHYKIAMPRIYKEAIYTQEEREEIGTHVVLKQKEDQRKKRKGWSLKQRIDYINNYKNMTKEKDKQLLKKTSFVPSKL